MQDRVAGCSRRRPAAGLGVVGALATLALAGIVVVSLRFAMTSGPGVRAPAAEMSRRCWLLRTETCVSDHRSGFDGNEFRRVLGRYPTGVAVVTAACEHGPEGFTIGSFTSVSLNPPLVSFCAGHDSESWTRMRDAGGFCVNVLGIHQADVSSVFASKSEDRFKGLRTRVEATGSPVIEGCEAWIDCETEVTHAAGDHDIVIGRVVGLGAGDADADERPADSDAGGPLIFHRGGYRRLAEL